MKESQTVKLKVVLLFNFAFLSTARNIITAEKYLFSPQEEHFICGFKSVIILIYYHKLCSTIIFFILYLEFLE